MGKLVFSMFTSFVGLISLSAGLLTGLGVGAQSTDDIHLLLYKRVGLLGNWTELQVDLDSLVNSGFNPDYQTIIISHGFTANGRGFGEDFGKAYSEVGGFNLISIDWEILAKAPNYIQAAKNTKLVGEYVAKLVSLIAQLGDISNLHLVGHSLGAHVVGHIGKTFQQEFSYKIPRITGLDPARPYFTDGILDHMDGLTKEDAEFVDVIHTNSGKIVEGCLSIFEGVGHMDFYPNGGRHQPGCKDLCFLDSCAEKEHVDVDDQIDVLFSSGFCSHSRAVEYFVESIQVSTTSTKFDSWWCDSWDTYNKGECCNQPPVSMGHHLTRKVEGSYMLSVGERSPFSLEESERLCKTSG